MHVLTGPSSAIPIVGASGAISGVMGAYMVLYPRVRILTLVFVFLTYVPAWLMLGYWFLIQFLSGTVADGGAGVAFWAHVGGFFAGVLLVKAFARKRLVEAKLVKAKRACSPEPTERSASSSRKQAQCPPRPPTSTSTATTTTSSPIPGADSTARACSG